ncbi:MAG: HAD family hydrolase, partial [Bifidobacteriales bacterium]|nr:HAD family hydrolase [Bifidobacteriales bacterium]
MAAGDGDIKVPGWRDMDLDVVSGKADVLAFDLDNTLALSKTRMDEAMARHFAALTHLRPVAIISGGRFLQFRNQVLAALPEDTD